MSKLAFARTVDAAVKGAELVVFLAPRKMLRGRWLSQVAGAAWAKGLPAIAKGMKPGTKGAVASTYPGAAKGPKRVVLAMLPDHVSRHNSPARHEAAAHCAGAAGLTRGKKTAVILGVDVAAHVLPVANGIARKLPLFTRKNGKKATLGNVVIASVDADGKAVPANAWVKETVASSRWAASMVDTPPAELQTSDFAREARKLVRGLTHVRTSEIVGNKLLEKKLGGIHGVGRAAKTAPRLLILDYRPTGAKRTVCLVGKGIIFDTGGLSLKGTLGMCSMKGDMGGGAAVVGAFRTLAANKVKERVVCLVPLAENAIGHDAYRNDDILYMHSGKTVEINNTDAEGRLLLADAVSYACKTYKPDAVIDAATLTGAQLISSGLRHASIVSNREGLEQRAISSGRACGDLAHALLFAPEFYQHEFESKVADMRNSVANRSNAQSSCAAQFVYSHIQDLDVPWLHVDMAGPSWRQGRGTGYGVALMSTVVREMTAKDLKA